MTRLALVYSFCAILLALAGCGPRPTEKSQVGAPLSIPRTASGLVDIDALYGRVDLVVREVLPRAYFRAMVYKGTCAGLPSAEGTLGFLFEQVGLGILRRQVWRADVFVDTHRERMDVDYSDVSGFRPTVLRLPFPSDAAVKRILTQAHDYLQSVGIGDCTVLVSQSTPAGWQVECQRSEPPENCGFSIVNDEIR